MVLLHEAGGAIGHPTHQRNHMTIKHLGQNVSDAVGEEAMSGLLGLGQAPAELPVEHSPENCPQTSVMVTGNASKMITSCGLEMKEIIPTGSNSFMVNREKKSFPHSIRRDAENPDSLAPSTDKSYGGATGALAYHRLQRNAAGKSRRSAKGGMQSNRDGA